MGEGRHHAVGVTRSPKRPRGTQGERSTSGALASSEASSPACTHSPSGDGQSRTDRERTSSMASHRSRSFTQRTHPHRLHTSSAHSARPSRPKLRPWPSRPDHPVAQAWWTGASPSCRLFTVPLRGLPLGRWARALPSYGSRHTRRNRSQVRGLRPFQGLDPVERGRSHRSPERPQRRAPPSMRLPPSTRSPSGERPEGRRSACRTGCAIGRTRRRTWLGVACVSGSRGGCPQPSRATL
jgi:hypothetical protein